MSLHCILAPFIESMQCRPSCSNAICRMMHCCVMSCIMSLHCIHVRNNRVLGHCRGKVSRIPGFQAVETSCLKIFIIICPLLSPSEPIDRSYFVPTYAVSFEMLNTGAGLILSKSRFRTPFAGVAEAPRRMYSRRIPDSPGSCGLLSEKSFEISFSPPGESMFKRTWQVVFRYARNNSGVPRLLAAGSESSLLQSRELNKGWN